jgi:hypothetical protein
MCRRTVRLSCSTLLLVYPGTVSDSIFQQVLIQTRIVYRQPFVKMFPCDGSLFMASPLTIIFLEFGSDRLNTVLSTAHFRLTLGSLPLVYTARRGTIRKLSKRY